MAGAFGTKETKEALTAMRAAAVLIYKAQKGAKDAAEVAQRLPALALANPGVIEAVKAGFENVGEIPNEIKDLSFGEVAELAAHAAKEVAGAAAEVEALSAS